ncbi:MAG: penicillin acylase family protein, partial [Woeseiaceae bacterium]
EWLAEDSLLVAYAMFLDLNDARAARDIQRGYAQRVLHPAVFRWMYPEGTRWDAALTGQVPTAAELPGPDILRLDESTPDVASIPAASAADDNIRGSNNWAVSGFLSRSGSAIVANDMHLGLAVPNVFYRARLVQVGAESRDVTGVTLPGTPVIVTGSNGNVAWAFTNSYGDWSDAVVLQPGRTPGTYKSPLGDEPFIEYDESIAVKGADDVIFRIRESRWGPVLEDTPWPDGELAVRWIGHDIDAINLLHVELETAKSVDEAIQIASRLGIPPQNFVCGDAKGNIAWTIAGRIPVRTGFDASVPADWSAADGWTGWLAASDYPRVVNPPSGRIWTANSRVIDGEYLRAIGNGGYDLGARAAQIRDKLFEKDRFDTDDMLAIQLDDRALFLTPWRELLLSVLGGAAGDPQMSRYRALVEDWQPRASAESVGYRLVRGFRLQVRALVFEMLALPVREAYPYPVSLRISNQFEQPLWTLVTTQPAHLLSAEYPDWDALLLRAVEMNLEQLAKDHGGNLEDRSWGEFNSARIRHPLSRSLGFLSPWLDMPQEPLDGDSNMPRVVRSDFGASERFGVSPGNEQDGYLHMPAGQSGHPLSDFYRAGHDDWVRGRATPFLPGAGAHTLTLAAPGP